MRRVKLFIASSLDGYIAGPDDDISWLFDDGDYGYEAFSPASTPC
jgi:dihydrofolate reductase